MTISMRITSCLSNSFCRFLNFSHQGRSQRTVDWSLSAKPRLLFRLLFWPSAAALLNDTKKVNKQKQNEPAQQGKAEGSTDQQSSEDALVPKCQEREKRTLINRKYCVQESLLAGCEFLIFDSMRSGKRNTMQRVINAIRNFYLSRLHFNYDSFFEEANS